MNLRPSDHPPPRPLEAAEEVRGERWRRKRRVRIQLLRFADLRAGPIPPGGVSVGDQPSFPKGRNRGHNVNQIE